MISVQIVVGLHYLVLGFCYSCMHPGFTLLKFRSYLYLLSQMIQLIARPTSNYEYLQKRFFFFFFFLYGINYVSSSDRAQSW